MSLYDDQIKERKKADRQLLEDSLVKVAGVVLGKGSARRLDDQRIITQNAIDEILKYYHYKPIKVSEDIEGIEAQLNYVMKFYGIMNREIELSDKWYKDSYGPIFAYTRDEELPVALIPGRTGGYYYKDPKTNNMTKLNKNNADMFMRNAYCFYRPLPQKKLGIKDLFVYLHRCINAYDIALIIISGVALAVIGLLITRLTKALTGSVLNSGRTEALIGLAICMVCITASSKLIECVKTLLTNRLTIKTSLGVQSSMMMRILTLPAGFFRKYSAGELKSRSMSVNQLCDLLMNIVLSTGLTSITSLIYIFQITRFAKQLAIPALLISLTTVIISFITTITMQRLSKKQMEISAKESGMSYQMITGVSKIKLSGAETRFFAKWLDIYSEEAALAYNPPLLIKLNTVITTAITLFSNIIIYYIAVKSHIDQSSYFAFASAYGMVSGAFLALTSTALSAAQIKPILEMAEPFLNAVPETSEGREVITRISGGVEMDHVSFRYSDDTPYILNDMSLKIRPGEYVAIVGKTGCGKSTLMRLLLGFETAEKGNIYYDRKSINSIDLPTLRSHIGTVMQDSGLFQGDIYSNIVISAPELSLDDAWEAAEIAGIADDIRAMPMGMHTVISEGQGGISGGQRQRLMIARAVAPKPKLIMFDEATSALDNKTQKQVSDALDRMKCTRIVIAHRLSTIRHCDRILVLDGGNIIEDGTYEELIELNGRFAELVARQRLDTEE